MFEITWRARILMLPAAICCCLCSACSLIKVDMGGDPMPTTQMNAKLSAHEFAEHFALNVESVADSIFNESSDRAVQMNALRWKIGAIDAIRTAAFRMHPYGAQVDCWTLCFQMEDLLETGGASTAFGPYQSMAVALARQLRVDAEEMVSHYMPEEKRDAYRSFITDYVVAHPIVDLDFARESATSAFLDYLDVPDSARVTTVGTLPQVVHGYGSEMTIWTDQWPRQARWRTELVVMEHELDQVDLRRHMDSLTAYADRIAAILETSPQLAREISGNLVAGLDPLLAAVERERTAVMQGFDDQRIALTATLKEERETILASMDATAVRVVDVAVTRLREGITTFLFWAAVIVALALCLPFAFGYLAGRATGRRARAAPVER